MRWLLKRRAVRKVGKDGIHFESDVFVAPELNGLAGEAVQVAYRAHDLREVDVYRDGDFLCTAQPRETLTAEDRVAFLAARKEDRKRATSERRKASRRQRVRYIAAGLADPPAPARRHGTMGKPRAQRKLTTPTKRPPHKLLGLDKYNDEEDKPDA